MNEDIELSPLGAGRERACPCRFCRRMTWNVSARCNACIAEQRDTDRFDEHEIHDGDEVAV